MSHPGESSEAIPRDFTHIDRLFDLWMGDPGFRSAVTGPSEGLATILAQSRVELQAEHLSPFVRVFEVAARAGADSPGLEAELKKAPIGRAWLDWKQARTEAYEAVQATRLATGIARVDTWRKRQICRVNSEAYPAPYDFAPPLFAFELSKGCSKQCWFCAFSPPTLQETFLHTRENAELWRDVVESMHGLFGAAMHSSVLFHATEPTDNSDYLEFLSDFHAICGSYPHTTTAQPLKDVEWTRRLLAMRSANPAIRDRFSVLSVKSLHDIFRAFAPEEMAHVALALHNSGALTSKNHCGSALRHARRLNSEQEILQQYRHSHTAPQTTLECTIGYLVNMVDRTIELISPTNALDQWPLGYIVHGEGRFDDAGSFLAFVRRSIEQVMRDSLPGRDPVALRADLCFESATDGFVLTSRYRRHELKGNAHFALLGRLLSDGRHCAEEVAHELANDGMPVLTAVAWLERLYQGGLLREAR